MTTPSRILAQRISWTEEPGRIQSMGSQESDMTYWLDHHNGSSPGGATVKEPACQCRRCKRCRFKPWVGKIPWRRKWWPSSVSLPGKFHGQRSPVGCSPWSCTESDTTEYMCTHALRGRKDQDNEVIVHLSQFPRTTQPYVRGGMDQAWSLLQENWSHPENMNHVCTSPVENDFSNRH